MHCIGIDVSKKTLDVFCTQDGSYYKIQNSYKTIIDFIQNNDQESIVLYEATGIYSKALEKALNDLQRKHYHVHAQDLHNLLKAMGDHNKTDKLDCKYIAEMGIFLHTHFTQFGGKNKFIVPNTNELNAILAMMTEIRRMKHFIAQIKQASETLSQNIYAPQSMQDSYQGIIKQYQILIADLYKEVGLLLVQLGHKQTIKNLSTIPGISKITATELVVFFVVLKQKGFEKKDVKKVIAYSGLNPIQQQSGTSLHKVQISKKGQKHIRTALYMPGMVWYNLIQKEKYQATNLGHFFTRMKDKFSPNPNSSRGKSVITAMSKKLLSVSWGIFCTNTVYDFS